MSYEQIWRVVEQIPYGCVATYGEVARLAGLRNGARQVGYALHALPEGIPVPWHRVVNAKGMISLPKRSRPYGTQRRLLEAEGIRFIRGGVELRKYGWVVRGKKSRQ